MTHKTASAASRGPHGAETRQRHEQDRQQRAGGDLRGADAGAADARHDDVWNMLEVGNAYP